MERTAKLVCSVVGFLGLLSAALSFAAEGTKTTASEIQLTADGTGCVFPSSPALGLGLTAAVVLLTAQIIINVTTGCICCRRGSYQSNSSWTVALICFVVSWITFVIAFLMILTGAALNQPAGEENMYFGNNYCYVVKPGVFAGAAVLSLASVALGIVYYLALGRAKIENGSWGGTAAAFNQSGVAMAQPQFPQQGSWGGTAAAFNQSGVAMAQPQFPQPQVPPPDTEAPVFVHEDTYMRRQFT